MLACFFLLYRTIPNDLTACSLTASLGISFAWIERKCDIYIKDCYMNATIKKNTNRRNSTQKGPTVNCVWKEARLNT